MRLPALHLPSRDFTRGTCRGEPRDCVRRYAPLVPEDAREGAKAMAWAGQRGLSFDDLLDEARDDVLALSDWATAVNASCRRSDLRSIRKS